jgi:hypothetical protein
VVWPRLTNPVGATMGSLQSPDATCSLPRLKPPNQALQRTLASARAAEFQRWAATERVRGDRHLDDVLPDSLRRGRL